MGWLSVYSLLSSHSDCDRTFYCLKTMLLMVALKRHGSFTRRYSVPRTAKWLRDLPLSEWGTGADLQRKQHPPLRLGWAASPRSRFPGAAPGFVTAASALAFGCAESCRNAAPSRGCLTLRCVHPTGEPSTSNTHLPPRPGEPKRLGGHTPLLATPYLLLLPCLAPPGMQVAQNSA